MKLFSRVIQRKRTSPRGGAGAHQARGGDVLCAYLCELSVMVVGYARRPNAIWRMRRDSSSSGGASFAASARAKSLWRYSPRW